MMMMMRVCWCDDDVAVHAGSRGELDAGAQGAKEGEDSKAEAQY